MYAGHIRAEIMEKLFNDISKHFGKNISANEYSPLVLAYIGDSVYDVYVRTMIIAKGNKPVTYASRCIENAILSQMRLWWRTNLPRAEKNPNGVFWHRFPRIFISFVPLRTAM